MRTTLPVAVLALALTMASTSASAETISGTTLRIVVMDETHAVLPHAVVTVYTLDGNPGVRATADEHGIVYLPNVAPGLTQIVASFPGFAPALDKATLKAGDNKATVMLHLAPVVEKVTVTPIQQPRNRS
jgi:hypothetical protein